MKMRRKMSLQSSYSRKYKIKTNSILFLMTHLTWPSIRAQTIQKYISCILRKILGSIPQWGHHLNSLLNLLRIKILFSKPSNLLQLSYFLKTILHFHLLVKIKVISFFYSFQMCSTSLRISLLPIKLKPPIFKF